MSFLLYGANGYTGQIMLELLQEYQLKPIIAGRSATKIQPLAEQYGLDYRVIDLSDQAALDEALSEVPVVLHAAGPFKFTGRPMMEACMRTKTHYLDITGEIEVFELAKHLGKAAKDAGIMFMPGVGFDVVPTDCMAAFLHKQLPDATKLQLAFGMTGGGVSHGTATTMAENLGEGGAIRTNGRIRKEPIGERAMEVPFMANKNLFCMSIPWGDVSTAHHTTGIPHIETYMATHPKQYKMVKWQKWLGPLLRTSFARNYVKSKIKARPAGPTAEQRNKACSLVWGRVTNEAGQTVEARYQGQEGYNLTARSALMITKKVIDGQWTPGFHTPAGHFGHELVMELPNSSREVIG